MRKTVFRSLAMLAMTLLLSTLLSAHAATINVAYDFNVLRSAMNVANDHAQNDPLPGSYESPDGTPSLSIGDVTLIEGNFGTTSFAFTVSIDSPAPASGVGFNASTADGTATAGDDYIAMTNHAVTIPAGSSSTLVYISVNGDQRVEPNETFYVNISNVTGATILDGQAVGTIIDDDTAGIILGPWSGHITTEGGGTSTISFFLTSEPSANVAINVSSSDTTEGTVSPASLIFTSANWSTSQQVTITGVDDAILDGDVVYTIVITVSTTDPHYNMLNPPDISVTNLDNEGNTGSLTLQLQLQGRPTAPHASWITPVHIQIRPYAGHAITVDIQVTTDNLGIYTVSNIPVGDYTVWVKGLRTLSSVHVTTLVGGSNRLEVGVLREGDANNDNQVTLTDFSILASAFGTQTGDASFDARADFNVDGMVTLPDFSLLASNFGLTGAPP